MQPITNETLLKTAFLGPLKTPFNTKRFAFTKAHANLEDNSYEYTLYIGDEQTIKKVRKLGKNQGFIWLSDKEILLDLQKNKQEEKAKDEAYKQSFYRYHIHEKTLKKAFDLPFRGSLEGVLKNGKILFSAFMTPSDHTLYEANEEARKDYLKEKKKASNYEDIETLPYQYNGMGFTAGKVKQFFLYNTNDNQVERLTDKEFSIADTFIDYREEKIYYIGKMKETVQTFTQNLYVYDIKTKTHEMLYSKRDMSFVKVFTLKGRVIVAARSMARYGLNENSDFYTVDSNELTLLATHSESLGNTIGTDVRLAGGPSFMIKDDALYFITTIDDHSEVRKLTAEGELTTALSFEGSIDSLIEVGNKTLGVAMHKTALQEVREFDFDRHTHKARTRFNKALLKDKYVATPKVVEVPFKDHTVKGFVLLPKDYNEDKKYPAILNIHGGPKTVYGPIFYHEMQMWASKGYVVMFANPRGSDGKGNAFADIRGKYGTIDYDDLMAFTESVLARFLGVDKDRLFVTGGSYGGFMTNWMIGHTHRFKAAATQRSISNWVSFYGTSDIGYFFATDQTAGHPITNLDKLYDQSPIKYVDKVKTPLLIIHSDQDYRCPFEQAQQFYALLKTQGVESRFVWIKGENHELSRSGKPQARLKRLDEITAWFDKYC